MAGETMIPNSNITLDRISVGHGLRTLPLLLFSWPDYYDVAGNGIPEEQRTLCGYVVVYWLGERTIPGAAASLCCLLDWLAGWVRIELEPVHGMRMCTRQYQFTGWGDRDSFGPWTDRQTAAAPLPCQRDTVDSPE